LLQDARAGSRVCQAAEFANPPSSPGSRVRRKTKSARIDLLCGQSVIRFSISGNAGSDQSRFNCNEARVAMKSSAREMEPRMKFQTIFLSACACALILVASPLNRAVPYTRDARALESTTHFREAASRELAYQGNYDEALRAFAEMSNAQPEKPDGDFYQAVALVWKSYVDAPRLDAGNRAFDAEIERLLVSAIKKAEAQKARPGKSKEDEIEALYYLGSSQALRSRLSFYHNQAIPAARAARAAQDYFDALLKLDENYWDAYYASGSIYYRVGLLTDSSIGRLATTMLGAKSLPVGDRERGLNYLKIAAEKAPAASVDAKLALLEIYTFNDISLDRAATIARELQSKYPGNQTFARYLLKIYLESKNRAELMKTARQILARVKEGKPNFGAFMKAEAERALAEANKK
jgi:hypothetical protein